MFWTSINFSKVHICIDSLINQTILELKPLTVNKQISLKSDIRASGTVFCDPDRIEQVLTNLIKNSIDFVNVKDGKITVRVEKAEDSKVIFTVEDNGIAIGVLRKPISIDDLIEAVNRFR
jgi:signal transduction histidine kinase